MKKIFVLLCAALLVVLCACSASDAPVADAPVADAPVTDTPVADAPFADTPVADTSEAISPPEPVLPFDATVDISASFTEQEQPSFDEAAVKESLCCEQMDTSTYAQADDTITISDGGVQQMILHGTWAPGSKTIYIGFLSETSGDVYTLSSAGGALSGTLDLRALPDGQYRPILFSSDNEKTIGTVNYQFR